MILWRRSYCVKTGRSAAAACTKEFENWDQSGVSLHRLSSAPPLSFILTMLILDLVRLRPSFILLLLIALQSFIIQPINVDAQSDNFFLKHRGEGLWGGIKNTVDPIHHSIKRNYNNLSNNGRFIAGGCVGYGVSRVIIRSKLFVF